MKTTRTLLSLTLLTASLSLFAAASSDQTEGKKWATVIVQSDNTWKNACLTTDKLDKTSGELIKANQWQYGQRNTFGRNGQPSGQKERYIYADEPTTQAVKSHKKAAQLRAQKAIAAKEALHNQLTYFNEAFDTDDVGNAENKAAQAYAVFTEQDVRTPHKLIAREGQGMQRVEVEQRPAHTYYTTDVHFVKPSNSAPHHYAAYYDNGTSRHNEHEVYADYEWEKQSKKWQAEKVKDHTRGWLLSGQSMTRQEKLAKKAMLEDLLQVTRTDKLYDSAGNTTYYDPEISVKKLIHGDNKTDNVQESVSYAQVAQRGLENNPTTISALRNALRDKQNQLNTLTEQGTQNTTSVKAVRAEYDRLQSHLNGLLSKLDTLKRDVLPHEEKQYDTQIKKLIQERDSLIKKLSLDPTAAYYVQATLDALCKDARDSNEQLTEDELIELAFGKGAGNDRSTWTKLCAQVVRHTPDNAWLLSNEPREVREYYEQRAQLDTLNKQINEEKNAQAKSALLDQEKQLRDHVNRLATNNMKTAQYYINTLIRSDILWKDTKSLEADLHQLHLVLRQLHAAHAAKDTCRNAHRQLQEQLDKAEGKIEPQDKQSKPTVAESSDNKQPKNNSWKKQRRKGKKRRRRA